jgi:DNA-binding transcriptional LysR family regulator
MELRHLRYFIMAADEANISRAAARLNVSQPAVSRQIRHLEGELGVALFKREPQGLRLTPAGEVALAQAKSVLRKAQQFTESMQAFSEAGSQVTLKVGFIPTALPGLLAEGLKHFNRAHEKICIQISEMPPANQIAELRRGEIDLALPGAASPKVREEFFTRSLRTTPLAMVVPTDHPLADQAQVELSDFGQDAFLSLDEARFPGRDRMQARLFQTAAISPKVALHAHGLNELLGLVAAGSGVAMVPADLERMQSGGVTFLKLRRPKLTFHSAAVWRDSAKRPAVEALVEVLAATKQSR